MFEINEEILERQVKKKLPAPNYIEVKGLEINFILKMGIRQQIIWSAIAILLLSLISVNGKLYYEYCFPYLIRNL